ncbi:MAG: hypothetical protein QNJ51_08885 [Calothrix sp. MO_167.B12]|nr:hypothetical protein [Calothrix sp. MO_167.B12]
MQSSLKSSSSSQPFLEINGRPGVVLGNFIVPASGRSKIKIIVVGDLIKTNINLAYGLEKKEIFTPISEVQSIEIAEGRLWWLLGLGIFTLFAYFIGIIFIILFFIIKQRWVIIYTSSVSLILFHKKTESVEQFRQTVLKIRRQINTLAIPKTNGAHPPLPNKARTSVSKGNYHQS